MSASGRLAILGISGDLSSDVARVIRRYSAIRTESGAKGECELNKTAAAVATALWAVALA